MTAPAVVKHLDVIDDILAGIGPAQVSHSKNLLYFEATEKTLGDGIIPTITFSAHAGQYAMVLEQFLEIMTAILTTPVRLKDETS